MRNIQATGNYYSETITIKQISKQTARKLFASGETIYLQSSNMRPFNMWQSVHSIELDKENLQSTINHRQFCINLHSENIERNKDEIWYNPEHDKEQLAKYQNMIINEASQFDSIVNNYAWYNCDNQRGNYVTFYKQI